MRILPREELVTPPHQHVDQSPLRSGATMAPDAQRSDVTISDFPSVLTAAQLGEGWAVERIYRALHPPLLVYLRSQVPAEADDLAGEVWLAAARGLASFSGDEDGLRGWLFTIARRQVIGHWRRTGRRRTDAVPTEALADTPGIDDTEAAALEAADGMDAVRRLVEGLPAEQAEVVLLRVVAGLDTAQVAEVLGKRPGTVRVLQHRALKRLAQLHPDRAVTL